jgi:hypothetical protein
MIPIEVIIAALLRLILTALVIYKLMRWGHMLIPVERFGLGIIGGSAFMTVPVILDAKRYGTPFDTWAGVLFTLGVTLYLAGRLSRHIRHERANDAMVAQHEARIAGRR